MRCDEKLEWDHFLSQGCYDEMVQWIEDNAVILIAIAFVIAVIEVNIKTLFQIWKRKA